MCILLTIFYILYPFSSLHILILYFNILFLLYLYYICVYMSIFTFINDFSSFILCSSRYNAHKIKVLITLRFLSLRFFRSLVILVCGFIYLNNFLIRNIYKCTCLHNHAIFIFIRRLCPFVSVCLYVCVCLFTRQKLLESDYFISNDGLQTGAEITLIFALNFGNYFWFLKQNGVNSK